MSNNKEILKELYGKCFTVADANTDVPALMSKLLAPNFQSKGSTDTTDREHLIGRIVGFRQMVPNLKWDVQEMIAEGDKVTVRSFVSGTPVGNFMGVPVDGKKSFKALTIDVHTVKNGQILEVYHLEDWATAIKQVSN